VVTPARKERRWWPWVKLALAVVVVAAVGRQFYLDIGRLGPDRPPIHLGWLALAAVLYLAGMGFSVLYWGRLMHHLGASPSPLRIARAHYVSQLGKYAPGKALALLLRVGMVTGPDTRASIAALAAFHEVLATMASGALVGCLCAFSLPPGHIDWPALWRFDPSGHHEPGRWQFLALGLALFLITAVPILPPIFNRLAAGVARPFAAAALPRVGWAAFFEGLLTTAPCWPLFGMALECGLHAVDAPIPPLPHLIAAMALAYVAGFVVPISPGGLGVREFVLALLLAGQADAGVVALAVLLLRLAWTLAECVASAILYPLPARAGPGGAVP
jgi:uncharacterized membrane protein YbhN (UPF0104 family)